MHILSVNTGKAVPFDNKTGKTAINKTPRTEPVEIRELGLAGDEIADLENHGGPDQAVYLYGQPDYDFFARQEGREMAPGLFGENLTIDGLESQKIHIGDRFAIGTVLLETTSPRIPCATFAARMNDKHWLKKFHKANRPGVYCRVLETGTVRTGDTVRLIPFGGTKIAITELMQDYKNPSLERMRYLMQAPVHRELVAMYEERLNNA